MAPDTDHGRLVIVAEEEIVAISREVIETDTLQCPETILVRTDGCTLETWLMKLSGLLLKNL